MKPHSGTKNTNPNKPNFTYPQRGKTEVRCRMSEVRYLSSAFCFLSSVHGHESKPTFAVRKGRPNSQYVEFNTAFSDGARFITPKADKIALKIYPFGIDCPIVFKERFFDLWERLCLN